MPSGDPLLLAEAARRARAGTPRRRGGWSGLRWVALVALLVALVNFLASMRREVEAGGLGEVHTDRARLETGPGWVDPRWQDELRAALAELDDLAADDREAALGLQRHIASLSFVESAGEVSAIWPDGLRVEVELREPVACVHLGRHFYGVAADGTVLSGRWPTPPARDTGFLPVIELGPSTDAGRRASPGVRLEDPAAVDGLSVAVSMWRELDARGLARLGRCVIDARRARFASVEEAGTVLRLEGRRAVWFGRSPNLDEPGELPVREKWGHLAAGLALLEPDPARSEHPAGLDWDLLDVRWDIPDVHPREGGLDAGSDG